MPRIIEFDSLEEMFAYEQMVKGRKPKLETEKAEKPLSVDESEKGKVAKPNSKKKINTKPIGVLNAPKEFAEKVYKVVGGSVPPYVINAAYAIEQFVLNFGKTIPYREAEIGAIGRHVTGLSQVVQKKLFESSEFGIQRVNVNRLIYYKPKGMGSPKNMATKTQAPKKDSKNVEAFPRVFPLAPESLHLFESQVQYMIANKGKLGFMDVMHTLDVVPNEFGDKWNGRMWKMFVGQFLQNSKTIAEYFGVKDKFKSIVDAGYDYIVYR